MATTSVNAAAQSALRDLATDEEDYLTDYLHYGSFTQLAQDGRLMRFHVERGIAIRIVHLQGAHGYCFSATTATRRYMYDDYAGGVYRGTHCRKITTGRSGGTRSGPVWIPSAPGSGTDSPIQKDLRNVATLEEAYYGDHHAYADFDQLSADPNDGVTQIHSGVTVTIVHIASLSYCMHATSGTQSYMYDSGVGQPLYPGTSCRFTTSGPSGGTRTGPATV